MALGWQTSTKSCLGTVILFLICTAASLRAQDRTAIDIYPLLLEMEDDIRDWRLLNKLYNKEFYSWTGRNIDPELDFHWKWLRPFSKSGQSALVVVHSNGYGCGMHLCTIDIWLEEDAEMRNIGGALALGYEQPIEVSQEFRNGFPVVFAGHRAHIYHEGRYLDANNVPK